MVSVTILTSNGEAWLKGTNCCVFFYRVVKHLYPYAAFVFLAEDRFRPIYKKVLDQPQASLKTRSYDNLFITDRDVEVEIAVDSQPEPSTGPN